MRLYFSYWCLFFVAFLLIWSCQSLDGSGKNDKLFYYENGNIKKRIAYEDSLKHGKYEEYYNDGVLKSIGFYKEDTVVGDVKFYSLGGHLIEKNSYQNGVLRYVAKYDSTGKIIQEVAFPRLYIEADTSSDEIYFVADLENYVFDSVQIIVGTLGKENRFVSDTTCVAICVDGICKYKLGNRNLGSNLIEGVIQDIKYQDNHIVNQNITPFEYNYVIEQEL